MAEYRNIIVVFLLVGILLNPAGATSSEFYSSPTEKLALGKRLSLEDFKGRSFFASALNDSGFGYEASIDFDNDGNVQAIGLHGKKVYKVKKIRFDKKKLEVTGIVSRPYLKLKINLKN